MEPPLCKYLYYSFAHSRNLLVAIHYSGTNFQPELSSLTEVEYDKAKTELLAYLYQNQGFCKLSYAWKDWLRFLQGFVHVHMCEYTLMFTYLCDAIHCS